MADQQLFELTAKNVAEASDVVAIQQGTGTTELQKITVSSLFGNIPVPVTVNAAAGFTGNLLDLELAGTSVFVVKQDGKVGIGTTNPAAPLHINSTSGNGHLEMSRGTGRVQFVLNNDASDLNIYDGKNAAFLMTLKEGGNVGIGTANPSAKLTVLQSSVSAVGGIEVRDPSGVSKLQLYNDATNSNISKVGTGELRIVMNNSTKVVIDGNGQIAINDTFSQGIMTIKQRVDASIGGVSITNSTKTSKLSLYNDATNSVIGHVGSGELKFQISASFIARFTPTGQFVLGNIATPTAVFNVTGAVSLANLPTLAQTGTLLWNNNGVLNIGAGGGGASGPTLALMAVVDFNGNLATTQYTNGEAWGFSKSSNGNFVLRLGGANVGPNAVAVFTQGQNGGITTAVQYVLGSQTFIKVNNSDGVSSNGGFNIIIYKL